eukprot:Gb_32186 [translate_table: standard]
MMNEENLARNFGRLAMVSDGSVGRGRGRGCAGRREPGGEYQGPARGEGGGDSTGGGRGAAGVEEGPRMAIEGRTGGGGVGGAPRVGVDPRVDGETCTGGGGGVGEDPRAGTGATSAAQAGPVAAMAAVQTSASMTFQAGTSTKRQLGRGILLQTELALEVSTQVGKTNFIGTTVSGGSLCAGIIQGGNGDGFVRAVVCSLNANFTGSSVSNIQRSKEEWPPLPLAGNRVALDTEKYSMRMDEFGEVKGISCT